MRELTCLNCQAPKSQWKENSRQGYQIENEAYCSRKCSDLATQSIQEHGAINQAKGKELKHRADLTGSGTIAAPEAYRSADRDMFF